MPNSASPGHGWTEAAFVYELKEKVRRWQFSPDNVLRVVSPCAADPRTSCDVGEIGVGEYKLPELGDVSYRHVVAHKEKKFSDDRPVPIKMIHKLLVPTSNSFARKSMASDPFFPVELEREIFETAALLYPATIPSLLRVARRVLVW